MIHNDITDKIINALYTANNTLGYGFLEKVYENAMEVELKILGCKVQKQKNIRIFYKEKEVGDHYADLLVEDSVNVELKAAESICKEHEVQLINFLKSTSIEVGLLLNFGRKAEFKRKVFSNYQKTIV